MHCERVTLPGGGTAIACSRRRRRPRCQVVGCTRPGDRQCDYPLERLRYARKSKSKTCDRYLCAQHAIHAGPNLDYCPHHPIEAATQGDLFAAAAE